MQRQGSWGSVLAVCVGLGLSCDATPEPEPVAARQAAQVIGPEDGDDGAPLDADVPPAPDSHRFRLVCGTTDSERRDVTGSAYGPTSEAARVACRAKLNVRANYRTYCSDTGCGTTEPAGIGVDHDTCTENSRVHEVSYECRRREESGDRAFSCSCVSRRITHACTRCAPRE